MTANLAIPSGAVTVGDWILDNGTARSFLSQEVTIDLLHGGVELTAAGDQDVDGHVTRYALIEARDPFTADELRQFANAALAVADEMTHLAAVDELAGLVTVADLPLPLAVETEPSLPVAATAVDSSCVEQAQVELDWSAVFAADLAGKAVETAAAHVDTEA